MCVIDDTTFDLEQIEDKEVKGLDQVLRLLRADTLALRFLTHKGICEIDLGNIKNPEMAQSHPVCERLEELARIHDVVVFSETHKSYRSWDLAGDDGIYHFTFIRIARRAAQEQMQAIAA